MVACVNDKDFTRVAVAQLDFHPAALWEAESVIEDPLGSWPTVLAVPSQLNPSRKHLRRRIREAYLNTLSGRLTAVVDACHKWNVNLLVLPEYSVPWELLRSLADKAGDLTIVAGSHAVERQAVRSGVYESLGWNEAPQCGTAVAPVIHGGGIVALPGKVSASPTEERGGSFIPSSSWSPALTEGRAGFVPLAVLICHDFLDQRNPRFNDLILPHLEVTRVVAVPALTPSHTEAEFAAKAEAECRRYKKPTLYANRADGGGTTVFVDDYPKEPARAFPGGVATLARGEEGIVVVDVDLNLRAVGESKAHSYRRPVRAVAAASLVYRRNPLFEDYASWLENVASSLAAGDLDAALAEVQSATTLLERVADLPGAPTRSSRLRTLLDRLDHILRQEELYRYVREVVVPCDALPPDLVRCGLSQGAKQVIASWRSQNQPNLEQTEQKLIEAAVQQLEPERLECIDEALSELIESVDGGEGVDAAQRELQRRRDASTTVFVEHLLAEEGDIDTAFNHGRFAHAEALIRRSLELAERLAQIEPESAEFRRACATHRRRLATVLLAAQRHDEGRGVLEKIDVDALADIERVRTASAWASLGDADSAAAVLNSVSSPETEGFESAEARVAIARGALPDQLPSREGVLVSAGWMQLSKGFADEATSLARQALDCLDDDFAFAGLGSFALLTAALQASIWEPTWLVSAVPATLRSEVIDVIERLRFDALPNWIDAIKDGNAAELGQRLDEAIWSYKEAILDPDEWPERPNLRVRGEAEGKRAVEAALAGNIEQALEGVSVADANPWIHEFLRGRALALSGDSRQARGVLEKLSHDFPNRAPIEQLLANILLVHEDYELARRHAQAAFTLMPAGSSRVLLATSLNKLGRPSEGWDVIRIGLTSAGAGVLRVAAQLADAAEPSAAPEIWRRAVELAPEDSELRLYYARSLLALDNVDRAADEAFRAFELAQQRFSRSGERVSLPLLHQAGRMQIKSLESSLAEDRIDRVIGAVREQYPGKADAERVVADLNGALGREPGADVSVLVEAGLAMQLSLKELSTWMQWRERIDDTFRRLYEDGGISLAGRARAINVDYAQMLLRLLDKETEFFCAPIPLVEAPIPNLRSLEIVVGPMELLLLEHLGILGTVTRSTNLIIAAPLARELQDMDADARTSPRQATPPARLLRRVVQRFTRGEFLLRTWEELIESHPDTPPPLPALREELGDAEEDFRAPLVDRLRLAHALKAKRAHRRALTIDYFGTTGVGSADLGALFAWPGRRSYQEVTEYLRSVESSCVTLPSLIETLARIGEIRRPDKLRIGVLLARQGFINSLTPAELIGLTRATSPDSAGVVLRGIEAMARAASRSTGPLGRFALARAYSAAILHGALGEQVDTERARRSLRSEPLDGMAVVLDRGDLLALVRLLLERLEDVDQHTGNVLETTLSLTVLAVAERFFDALVPSPDDPEVMVLSESTPVATLWRVLEEWAGSDGPRRSSLDRSVCDGWIAIDRILGKQGPGPRVAPLLLAQTTQVAASALSVGKECLAIISANWSSSPLEHDVVHISRTCATGEAKSETVSWEVLLKHAARTATFDGASDGRYVRVGYNITDVATPVVFHLPTDAAVLRIADPTRLREGFEYLRCHQGAFDGIAHQILSRLIDDPFDDELRHEYARYSSEALWRRVRDDPSYVLRWVRRQDELSRQSTSLETLCRILHEPDVSLDEESSSDVEARRCEEWAVLGSDIYTNLVFGLASLPRVRGGGVRPAESQLSEAVGHALHRLEHAEDYLAAELARDVAMLQEIAVSDPQIALARGVVDLTEKVPEVILRAWRSIVAAERAYGRLETEILRVCGSVVERLMRGEGNRGMRDYLWLTHRLHVWLARQLSLSGRDDRDAGLQVLAEQSLPESNIEIPGETPQLFDPFRFDLHGFEYRKAVFLSGLVVGRARSIAKAGDTPPLTSAALEELMVEVSEGAGTIVPEKVESWVDWPLPRRVPDLAAYWLLSVNPKRLLTGDTAAVVRRIEAMPRAVDAAPEGERGLIETTVRALAYVDEIQGDVAAALGVKLESLEDGPFARALQWMGFARLAALGDGVLLERCRELLLDGLAATGAVEVSLAFFLEGVLRAEPDRLHADVGRVLDVSKERGLLALARLVVHAAPDVADGALAHLRSLAERPDLRDDETLSALLQHLDPAP